jgi:hypothetical protein
LDKSPHKNLTSLSPSLHLQASHYTDEHSLAQLILVQKSVWVTVYYFCPKMQEENDDFGSLPVRFNEHFAVLRGEVLQRWQQVGTAQGLSSDYDIASFLLTQ